MACRPPTLTFLRPFSSTSSALTNRNRMHILHSKIPTYPYGPSQWFKQSNTGLYGGTHIQFGNVISERDNKTRRRWKPNIQHKRLWSHALNRFVRVRVAARALRTIDKVGGLDEYLLGDKPARVKELGMGGWALRWRIMQTPAIKERRREERRKLGLPVESEGEEEKGEVVDGGGLQDEIRLYDDELDVAEKKAAVRVKESDEWAGVRGEPALERPVLAS
ncbi:MAG: 39S ribosomal protein L24, mitochondrial [Piccolia ochrophora]|nr:MAG: 39S ribosomal protein L24, mitochondrial [Piccolia ochrophora]